jgi:hypothetical protein
MCSISFQVLGGDVIAVQLNKTKGEASQGQTLLDRQYHTA